MSRSALRALGRMARQAFAEDSAVVKQQRRGMADYSPAQYGKATPLDRSTTYIPQNPYIEAWVWRRDHFEREFVWNKRTTFEVGYFLFGITAGFYALSVFMVRSSDERSGYKKRTMLGAETDTGFVLPDEREFY